VLAMEVICICLNNSAVNKLRVLRQNKLVKVRREGKQIYYTLDDDHVKKIIEMGLDHVLE
jgi:ArsR family transcriptional regulator, lead/cadmium/zinc/bismuth-responsive transcriptional repressor